MSVNRSNITAEVSQAQLDALGERMDKGFVEIKEMLRAFDERVRATERLEASCQPVLVNRMNLVERELEAQDQRLAALNKNVAELAQSVRQLEAVAKWILGIVTALIAAILIAFMTGRIDIVFR